MTRYNSLYGINFNLTYNRHDCTGDQSSFRDGGYPVIMTHSQSHGPAHTPFDSIDKVSRGMRKKMPNSLCQFFQLLQKFSK